MVEDSIQSLDTVTCGKFQIYFYDNLFNPNVNTKIQNNKKLTKKKNQNVAEEITCFRARQKRKNNRRVRTRTKHNNYMT